MTNMAMSKDENKSSVTLKNTPEVKILNRGDLLGAINCLFPELQLKSNHIKIKENFSLFSHSPQELKKIFESGRKYRTKIVNNLKSHSIYSLRTDCNRTNFKHNTNTLGSPLTKNMTSKTRKNKAQTKQTTHQESPSKRCETVQFSASYKDDLIKIVKPNFPERYLDFKNIERIIQELHNLFKDISKQEKIAPFNPNLPVLNISCCNHIVPSGSRDLLKVKPPTNTKHIRTKKSRSRLAKNTMKIENQIKGKEGKSKENTKLRRSSSKNVPQKLITKGCLSDDFDDENGRRIEQNIENLLSDDTFSPRYNAKRATIFRKTFGENNLPSASQTDLEKVAVEQYEEEEDEAGDINFSIPLV